MTTPLLVANCSGFYGDRLSAMREVLDGGPVDVVTGDYLAELTMLILGRQRLADPTAGWVRTFLTQLENCLATALERGVRIVSNAGGLNPAGLADAVRELATRLGLTVAVATVSGDDLLGRLTDLDIRCGPAPPGEVPVRGALTANAYFGCWGIVRALQTGAQVVITGRVTDASLVVGPAAWHHGWSATDLDALAGATAAGHVLECGAQAAGGNFSFFTELLASNPGALDHVGFPVAEIAADGSSVITKHPGTGGSVTVETVTEQLLYECTGAHYGGPDVVTRFDRLRLHQEGPDRVALRGAVGLPPRSWLKVATNRLGGFRNSVTIPLTGLHVDAKAALLRRQLKTALPPVAELSLTLARTDTAGGHTQEEASALLHITVKDPDQGKVGRAFTAPLIELALASIPGFSTTTAPPAPAAYGIYSPAWVPTAQVPQQVTLPDGRVEEIRAPDLTASSIDTTSTDSGTEEPGAGVLDGPTCQLPLGTVAGARSGDKGGNATLGVYARTDEGFRWLCGYLTTERLQALLPETAELPVTREVLAGLRALLFQLTGLLGEGVADSTRFDPQAKALGEWLRSRVVDVPSALLDATRC